MALRISENYFIRIQVWPSDGLDPSCRMRRHRGDIFHKDIRAKVDRNRVHFFHWKFHPGKADASFSVSREWFIPVLLFYDKEGIQNFTGMKMWTDVPPQRDQIISHQARSSSDNFPATVRICLGKVKTKHRSYPLLSSLDAF